MRLIHVAAGALNQTPLDWEGNGERIRRAIRMARDRQASILCLPELCVTGYGCEDAFHAPGVHRTAAEMLHAIAPETAGLVTCVGLPVMYAGGVFNSIALLVDSKIIGLVAKQHLAGDGIHYEQRWFKPWPEGVQAVVELLGKDYPIGDLLFDVGGVRIGFEICEDAWVAARPGAYHAARGADLILNPSASHFAFGKHSVRRGFVIEGSRAFNVTYVYANLVGNEAGRTIYDGDSMIASNGKLLANGPRLGFEKVYLTSCQVDIDTTRMTRARTGSFEPDLDGDESDVMDVPFDFPIQGVATSPEPSSGWTQSDDLKCEEFTRSVALGLFDYLCKSHSRGFVISLSGGADSAAATLLASLAFVLAEQELGFDRLKQRLGPWAQPLADLNELRRRAVTTVYQATRNSSEQTRAAAADVAQAMETTHLELDVDGLVEAYVRIVGQGLGLELNWKEHDIALQNIQARVRSPGVWMIANLNQALLLSTSNRSESAVGYATMDGDTSGGLAPLAGIDKAFLRRWLVWMERVGPAGIGPIPALQSINAQQPTAELRPPDQHQTDETDLMPYEILDAIERWAIRDKMMPVGVFEHLRAQYPEHPLPQLAEWTARFFPLWCRNQWKRERYAPSFHLDDENLDPKTWCRFPILSGGFDRELKQLEEHLAASMNEATQ